MTTRSTQTQNLIGAAAERAEHLVDAMEHTGVAIKINLSTLQDAPDQATLDRIAMGVTEIYGHATMLLGHLGVKSDEITIEDVQEAPEEVQEETRLVAPTPVMDEETMVQILEEEIDAALDIDIEEEIQQPEDIEASVVPEVATVATDATDSADPIEPRSDDLPQDAPVSEPPAPVEIAQPKLIERLAKKQQHGSTTPEAMALAKSAVDALLSDTDRKQFHAAQLSAIAFGGARIPKNEYKDFLNALARDDRIEYLGDAEYAVANRYEIYWPYDPVNVDREPLIELVDELADQPPGYYIRRGTVLGLARSQDIFLSQDEVNELEAIMATHPHMVPLENGDFQIKNYGQNEGRIYDSKVPRYSQKELHDMALALHGRVQKVLGRHMRVKHKRTFETLRRAPRIIHVSDLYNL